MDCVKLEILYYNTDDFLKQMEYIQKEFNSFDTYYKFVGSVVELEHQLKYLNHVQLLGFCGFTNQKLIKITIRDNYNNKIVIEYKFPSYRSPKYYSRMIKHLRRLEKQ